MSERELGPADVQSHLAGAGITVQELDADTSTAVLAAQALNTTVPTIVKSLLFLAAGEPVLVLTGGDRRVEGRLLARELGVKKVRMATPDEVVEIAGFRVGGVPPVGHRRPLPTLIDRNLLQHEKVFAAAGASNAIFPIEPQRLVALTGATITDAAK